MDEIDFSTRISVCLVLKDRGWIFEKMATRLAENLAAWNVDANIASDSAPRVDVNHWMSYGDVHGALFGKTTMLITHIDRWAKLYVLKQRLKKMDLGICLSRMTLEQLVLCDIPRERLCYITPAHDGVIEPKRIVIGITSQIRPDGAKRESVLIEMAHQLRLDAFHFEIIGPRWEPIIPHFQAAGATVRYSPGMNDNVEHLKLVRERLATFDYYLYMGWDEGSMGILDALAAGIPTIVTPQGFHLDINHGITYAFETASELSDILQKLAAERQRRIDGVTGLTWHEYARQHALVWRALLAQRRADITTLLHSQDTYTTPMPTLTRRNLPMKTIRPYFNPHSSALKEDFFLLKAYYTENEFRDSTWLRWARSVKRALIK